MTSDAPFWHLVLDGWCDPCAPPAGAPWEVEYDNQLEAGKRTLRDTAALGGDYRAVFARLAAPEFVAELAGRTGIDELRTDPTMHGAGLHATRGGGFLQVHLDFATHPVLPGLERRLSAIAFLHPEWRPAWGGQLLLCDPAGRAAAEIDPRPGRLVVFENGDLSYHGVRQTDRRAPLRVSAAAYYLAPARPGAARLRATFLPNRNAKGPPPEVAQPLADRI